MASEGHGLDNRRLEASSKSTRGDVIQIVVNSGSLAFLHKGFCCSAAKRRDWFCPIPGEGLFFAACPYGNPTDNFEHFLQARLCRFDGFRTLFVLAENVFNFEGRLARLETDITFSTI
jgi:hypothetical protein